MGPTTPEDEPAMLDIFDVGDFVDGFWRLMNHDRMSCKYQRIKMIQWGYGYTVVIIYYIYIIYIRFK